MDELVALENRDILKHHGLEVGPGKVSAGVGYRARTTDAECVRQAFGCTSWQTCFQEHGVRYERKLSLSRVRLPLPKRRPCTSPGRPPPPHARLSKGYDDTMFESARWFAMCACRRSVMIRRPLEKSRITSAFFSQFHRMGK